MAPCEVLNACLRSTQKMMWLDTAPWRTTQFTKGFEIEFRVLLSNGTQQACFERVMIG